MLQTHMTYSFQVPGTPGPTTGRNPVPLQNPNGMPTLTELESTLVHAGLPELGRNTDVYYNKYDGRPAYVKYAALDITIFFKYTKENWHHDQPTPCPRT